MKMVYYRKFLISNILGRNQILKMTKKKKRGILNKQNIVLIIMNIQCHKTKRPLKCVFGCQIRHKGHHRA